MLGIGRRPGPGRRHPDGPCSASAAARTGAQAPRRTLPARRPSARTGAQAPRRTLLGIGSRRGPGRTHPDGPCSASAVGQDRGAGTQTHLARRRPSARTGAQAPRRTLLGIGRGEDRGAGTETDLARHRQSARTGAQAPRRTLLASAVARTGAQAPRQILRKFVAEITGAQAPRRTGDWATLTMLKFVMGKSSSLVRSRDHRTTRHRALH